MRPNNGWIPLEVPLQRQEIKDTWAVFHGFSFPIKSLISILTFFYKNEDFFFNGLVCTQHKNTSTQYIPELLQDAPASELVAKLNSLDAADGKHNFFGGCFCTPPKLEAKQGREGGSPVYPKKEPHAQASWNLLVKTHANIPPGKKTKQNKNKKGRKSPIQGILLTQIQFWQHCRQAACGDRAELVAHGAAHLGLLL